MSPSDKNSQLIKTYSWQPLGTLGITLKSIVFIVLTANLIWKERQRKWGNKTLKLKKKAQSRGNCRVGDGYMSQQHRSSNYNPDSLKHVLPNGHGSMITSCLEKGIYDGAELSTKSNVWDLSSLKQSEILHLSSLCVRGWVCKECMRLFMRFSTKTWNIKVNGQSNHADLFSYCAEHIYSLVYVCAYTLHRLACMLLIRPSDRCQVTVTVW